MPSLLHHNTFGIDQSCEQLLEPASLEELRAMLPAIRQASPLLIIGAGSNLLLTRDFPGTVVHVCIKGIEIMSGESENVETRSGERVAECLLRCGAGEVFDDIVSHSISHGLYGLENLSLIPGEVGASAVQNIGAYGCEVKDFISTIEAIEIATGREVEISREECRYAYRYSRFKDEWKNRFVIHHVTYRLPRVFTPHVDYGNIAATLRERNILAPTALDIRNAVIDIRRAKLPDPEEEGNAGSFFVNPIVSKEKYLQLLEDYPSMPHYHIDEDHEKIPAGWMIEQCGWKGKTLGRAGVHSRQALVLVNKGGATGQEVKALCRAIQDDVFHRFGIHIQPEVNIV